MSRTLSSADISASGLSAERLRMEVVAENIANANTTRTPDGGPYRRKEVVFATAFQNAYRTTVADMSQQQGVDVVAIEEDQSPFPKVYQPGHPDADEQGFVEMPNVQMSSEMVDLITASRSYEANLKALRSYRQMVEGVLSLLRNG
ncbi:MAG: flagellar basal body rod protein FlgC [Planctomycetales bacterium]|nr:flagellar basal body rod protein FlgC [Planctomycetales bacterium]